MHLMYGNAFLTIIAASARHSEEGFMSVSLDTDNELMRLRPLDAEPI